MAIDSFFYFTLFTALLSGVIYLLNYEYNKKKSLSTPKLLHVFKFGYLLLFSVSFYFFLSNLDLFYREPENLATLLIVNGSMFYFFISVILFAFSMKKSHKFIIKLDFPSRSQCHRGSIKLGKIVHENHKKYSYYLDLEDLTQHMFICGITGSGKSNLVQYFLLKFTQKHSLPFLLAEFKGEYQFLQEKMPNLLILKPGENFSINMFNPEGADAQVHAERIFQIFESGGMFEGIEYSPQMERIFVDILNKVCRKKENRNWERFQEICRFNLEHSKDPTLEKSIQAIENRIRRYTLGTLKKIFVENGNLPVRELFKQNILLDLSSIIRLGGEKQDALFFLNMILKYLWDMNIERGSEDYEGIRHVTVIEDAQYFAPEQGSQKVKITSYIEDIALLLRGTGECLISLATRPNISKEILANCGILACFQTHMQKEMMMELLNLKDWQKDYLSMLKKGTCIVRVNSIEQPFMLEIPHVKRRWLTREEIKRNNNMILEKCISHPKKVQESREFISSEQSKAEKSLKTVIKPHITYCKLCGKKITNDSLYCSECFFKIEEEKDFQKLELFLEDMIKNEK